jgi:glycosyltransferase involved in cell wall biosynthesis
VRVLVYPHAMEIGGSQLNAVETGAALRDRGHDVTVISRPGPLVETARQLGLAHIPLDPKSYRRPSTRAMAQLTRLVQEQKFDVVHGYEWPPGVEVALGPGLRLGTPVLCTIYSMAVAPFLPHTLPLLVSTDNIRIRAEKAGFAQVALVEPPVDVKANAPGFSPGPFRADFGLDDRVPLLASVTRLTPELKLEGTLAACQAVGEIVAAGTPLQLVIAGDGPARAQVEQAAAAANARANGTAVVLTGQLKDPRPAYAAADLVIGMGSSAERALAFGKPLIVQGERGFWELLTPDTAPVFLRQGWYGIGDDADRDASAMRLEKILLGLLGDRTAWQRLAEFGRTMAVERFSLEHVAAVHEQLYQAACTAARPSRARLAGDALHTGAGLLQYKVHRRYQRWRGTAPTEDFNAVGTILQQELRGERAPAGGAR